MTKSLIISIHPEHALNILKGDKTRELRKSVPKGFIGWVYVYVTKGKPLLVNDYYRDKVNEVDWEVVNRFRLVNSTDYLPVLNGTIPFRFWFEEYDKYTDVSDCGMTSCGMECENDFTYKLYDLDDELEKLCLTYNEVYLYGQGKDLYAWHIKKLEIFDKPKALSEFYKMHISKTIDNVRTGLYLPVTKAPQNFMYVEVEE